MPAKGGGRSPLNCDLRVNAPIWAVNNAPDPLPALTIRDRYQSRRADSDLAR